MDIFNAFLHPIVKILPNIPEALLNFVIGFILIEVSVIVAKHLLKLTRLPKGFKNVLLSVLKAFLWLMVIIFILKALGLGNLVVAVSGSAIVLAFVLNTGLAPLIGDIISGIALAKDPHFSVGMKVSLNEGKTVGEIKSIDNRKVRIIDEEGRLHVVPNSVVEKAEWIVLEKKETEKERALKIRKLIRK